jgi:hypothetical protein
LLLQSVATQVLWFDAPWWHPHPSRSPCRRRSQPFHLAPALLGLRAPRHTGGVAHATAQLGTAAAWRCGGMAGDGWGCISNMGMDQYLLIAFLGGWTSIYQLFWCSPGVQGFDTLPH